MRCSGGSFNFFHPGACYSAKCLKFVLPEIPDDIEKKRCLHTCCFSSGFVILNRVLQHTMAEAAGIPCQPQYHNR